MDINISNEDIVLIEKFIGIRNKGYYCDGKQLTDVYNRVLNKRVNPTQCGSCLRVRVSELEDALNRYKRQQEKLQETPKQEEPVITPEEENKPVRKARKQGK